MHDLRLHVIPLTNESKDPPPKAFTVTPQEFSQVIDRVNLVYAGTNVRFLFDPEFDWAPLANTEINIDGANQRTLCNQIADAFPGTIVCFLRWGPGASPTGNGNAYPPPGAGTKPPHVNDVVQNYVALPNKVGPGFAFLSLGNGSFVAHELGHYLGLYHTFPGWTDLNGPVYAQFGGTMPSAAQADQAVIDYIAARGGTIDALNGDALSDTPPDPSPVLYTAHNQDICSRSQITVQGTMSGKPASFTFSPDVNNVMSYFGGCPPPDAGPTHFHFSAQQIKRFDDTLKHQSRRALVESPVFGAHSLQTGNAIARGPDRLDVLATDVNGRVCFGHWAQTTPGGNWNHWRPTLPDIAASNTPVGVVSRDPNKLDIFAAGGDGKTYTGAMDRNFGSGQWRGWWNILTGAIPAGGAVTAVSRDPNKLDIFIVSTDGGVYSAAWDQHLGGAQWRGWWRIGDLVAKPGAMVAAVARDPNKLDIFVAGDDGKTYSAAWDANVAGGWRGWWNILTGAIPPGGTITAVSRHPEKLDIFLASTDGGVYTAAWERSVASGQWRGWWRIGNLTTRPGAPVAAVARDPNKLDIFAAADDGKTYTAAWAHDVANGQWRGWWNILTGAIQPGWPVAAVSRDPGKLDIFIVSTDGGIYTAAWDRNVANGAWRGWWRIGV